MNVLTAVHVNLNVRLKQLVKKAMYVTSILIHAQVAAHVLMYAR